MFRVGVRVGIWIGVRVENRVGIRVGVMFGSGLGFSLDEFLAHPCEHTQDCVSILPVYLCSPSVKTSV